jgi:hypothetical protein
VLHLPLNIPISDLALGGSSTAGGNAIDVIVLPVDEFDLTTPLKTKLEQLGPERGGSRDQASSVPLILASVLTNSVDDHAVSRFANGQGRSNVAGAGGRGGVQD